MKGYYKEPRYDRRVFTPDGYFKTGDKENRDSEGYHASPAG